MVFSSIERPDRGSRSDGNRNTSWPSTCRPSRTHCSESENEKSRRDRCATWALLSPSSRNSRSRAATAPARSAPDRQLHGRSLPRGTPSPTSPDVSSHSGVKNVASDRATGLVIARSHSRPSPPLPPPYTTMISSRTSTTPGACAAASWARRRSRLVPNAPLSTTRPF